MAYKRTFWQDHVTEFEDRYTERENEDGTITHIPVEGEVIQQGTALDFYHTCIHQLISIYFHMQ